MSDLLSYEIAATCFGSSIHSIPWPMAARPHYLSLNSLATYLPTSPAVCHALIILSLLCQASTSPHWSSHRAPYRIDSIRIDRACIASLVSFDIIPVLT